MAELNIEILCANSSQAKGRVERANRTLQDRLVKELRLAQIGDIAAGNNFLPSFVERFNERFAVLPAKTEDLHRRLNVKGSRLADILCHREQRHVGQQLTLAYDRNRSSLSATSFRRNWLDSMSSYTISQTVRLKCDGRATRFPTGSSIKISG